LTTLLTHLQPGRSVALRFAQKYPVVLLARRPESYESTLADVQKAGGKAIGVSADVADAASLKKAFETINKELPDSQLAAAIYNVGSGGFVKKPFLELTENDLNASIDGSMYVVPSNYRCTQLIAQAEPSSTSRKLQSLIFLKQYQTLTTLQQ
jgi:NAD(P)-dependent dehydrogenase (short-subunit alcohol dehydrogenase family)